MVANPILEAFRTAAPDVRDVALRELRKYFPAEVDHLPRGHYPAMSEACGRAGWDDPVMDEYDRYDETNDRALTTLPRLLPGEYPAEGLDETTEDTGYLPVPPKEVTTVPSRFHFAGKHQPAPLSDE